MQGPPSPNKVVPLATTAWHSAASTTTTTTNATTIATTPAPTNSSTVVQRSFGERIRDSKAAIQKLNPFALRRRRKRRRSATTDALLSQQHASALSLASVRSEGRLQHARAVQTVETVQSASAQIAQISGAMAHHDDDATTTSQYLIALASFFFVCDYDEDGRLSRNELKVMMEILLSQQQQHQTPSMHQTASKRRRTRNTSNSSPTTAVLAFTANHDENLDGTTTEETYQDGINLEHFLARFGHELHSLGVPPAPKDFVHRCRRLKHGFRRCDTNGDNVMSVLELEIALQKLDVVVADDDLEQLITILDSDGDGAIEWSEMVRAAWTNTHLGPARNRNSVLLLDALADVPAPAILHHPHQAFHPLHSHASTRMLPSHSQFQRPLAPPQNETNWLTQLALKTHLLWRQDNSDDRLSTASSIGDTQELRPSSPFNSNRNKAPPQKSHVEKLGFHILTRISMHQVSAMKRVRDKRTHTQVSPTIVPLAAASSPSTVLRKGPTNVSGAKKPQSRQRSKRIRRLSTRVARTRLSPVVRDHVRRIEYMAIAAASIVGVLCGLVSMRIESLLPQTKSQDELTGDVTYFLYVILINIGVSLLEVNLMYLAAVVCAFRMTVATRLTLYPQDAEREFLTRAIARAALQVSHRTDTLFGMDPMKASPRFVLVCSALVFKSKRYILKFLVKLFIRRVLWRAAAKTVLSALVLPINAVLNAWTLRSVMRRCRVTILGPPCITALLDEFFVREDAKLLPYQRVDYLRALGCALVAKRCVHPNLEIIIGLLRRRWVHDVSWPVGDGCCCVASPEDPCGVHQLDDTDRFLASLLLNSSRRHLRLEAFTQPTTVSASSSSSETNGVETLAIVDHARNMVTLLILALIIDGKLGLSERRLYVRACHAGGIVSDWPAIRRLKNGFVNGDGLPFDAIYDVAAKRLASNESKLGPDRFKGDTMAMLGGDHDKTPWMDVLLYVGDRISALLSI